ncbi:hypothetical protein MRX96_026440 [Rhipicephalus microplus]
MNVLFAKLMLSTFLKQGVDTTRRSYYIISSFTYLGAMLASTICLQFVNYTTQVVGKSCKPIPVMVLGVLIGGKRYALSKYLFPFLWLCWVWHCSSIRTARPQRRHPSQGSMGKGELLLLVSLALDGLTGAVQERMKSEHQTKSGHMMVMTNLWSVVYLVIAQLFTWEILDFIHFIQKYPSLITNILLFSITGALGQTLIFRTFLGSVIIFNNPLGTRQWIGVVLVFSGLIADAYFSKSSKAKK